MLEQRNQQPGPWHQPGGARGEGLRRRVRGGVDEEGFEAGDGGGDEGGCEGGDG